MIKNKTMNEIQIIKQYAKMFKNVRLGEEDLIGMLVNFLAEIETARGQNL